MVADVITTTHSDNRRTSPPSDSNEAISLPLQAGGKDAVRSDYTKNRRESAGPDHVNLIGKQGIRLSSN
jgi:hypothetical protein